MRYELDYNDVPYGVLGRDVRVHVFGLYTTKIRGTPVPTQYHTSSRDVPVTTT